MREEILTKVLLKILKQQKKLQEDVDYLIEFLALINEKIDKK